MLKTYQFVIGLVLLIALEVARVFFIMPFPGSQRAETINLAYFIHENIFWFRTVGYLIILFPILHYFTLGTRRSKILVTVGLLLYAVVFYLFNFKFLADKMFYQPVNKKFSYASQSKVPLNSLILGIEHDGKSKAYPIEIIGYHHQVRDTIGGKPVMVTYCTVCRTGRAFTPEVNGQVENFRLVGMDHFNAMFEDESTGTWWRQVSGEAIAGPLKGQKLTEVFAEQMTLQSWLALHPDAQILQADSLFKDQYAELKGFDNGSIKNGLEKTDSLSWKEKSWVVGVNYGGAARAYDWNDLVKIRVINDTLAGMNLAVVLAEDSSTFHVLQRDTLTLYMAGKKLFDKQTQTEWNFYGKAVQGPLQGKKLKVIQSYQEFWHSWRTFHPGTTQFKLTDHR